MIVYYFVESGEVWNSIYDSEINKSDIDGECRELVVDEIQENAEICKQLARFSTFRDSNGLGRWHVVGGELYERDNWIPKEF